MRDYIVLDIEGTDQERTEAQIIEIAMIKFVDGQYHSCFETLVNPDCHIGNSRIHGITDAAVKDAPFLSAIMGDIAAFLDDFVLVGHNPTFDARLLREAYCTHLSKNQTFSCIDTVECVKQVFPSFKKRNLELLSTLFGFSVGPAHRAMHDTIATNRLLALCTKTSPNPLDMLEQARHTLPLPPKELHRTVSTQGDKSTLPLYGKRLVLTGVFRSSSKRLLALAEQAGATVDDDVKLSTDYLLIGRQNAKQIGADGMSTREKKARRHNATGQAHITFLREKDFLSLVHQR